MHSNSKLQRMIVIPPEVFDKWKHIITEDEKLSDLDKRMKTILFNKSINDINKWHQYRENLLKYSFIRKGNLKTTHVMKPITSEKITQTNRIVKMNKQVETTNDQIQFMKPELKNQESQTLGELELFNKNYNDDNEFCDSNSLNILKNANNNDENYNNDDDDECEMDYDDDEIRKTALQDVPKNVRIISERRSTDPQSYKTYELSNGDVVSVPITEKLEPKKKKNTVKGQSTLLHLRKVKKPSTRSQTKSQSQDDVAWDQYNS